MKKAFITGINGQDGSYLAELLLEKGYEIHGIIRRSSSFNTGRIEHLYLDDLIKDLNSKRKLNIYYGDMTDSTNIIKLIKKIQPDEIYNLAAQSHVKVSFELPEYTSQTDGLGILRILEAVRICKLEKKTKIYQASTSELFGEVLESPQNEKTPFNPLSPYAIAKLYAFFTTKCYREAYNIFAVNGILFNHESERRGETFVTRKITLGAARISKGKQKVLYLGNLSSKRDWGYAPDYVKSMWLMLQQDKPEDFVIGTGRQYTIRYFCELAFSYVGIHLKWKGKGIREIGVCKKTNRTIVKVSQKYFRPNEVNSLLADPSKAINKLGWNPNQTSIEKLVKNMIEKDIELINMNS